MADEQYHKLHPDEFGTTNAEITADFIAHCVAASGQSPGLGIAQWEAFTTAVEEAWNAGYRAARDNPPLYVTRSGPFCWHVDWIGPYDPETLGYYGWTAGPFWFRRTAQRHLDREKARHD